MTRLSAEAVAAAAYAGGFRGNQIIEAVAVAYAESSWDTTNKNSCCHGLWQINIKAHPNMAANVYDPITNAKYAFQIYNSEGGWCRTNNPPNCNPFQGYGNSNYKSIRPKAIEGYMSAMNKINKGQTPQQIIGTNAQNIPGGLPSASEALSSVSGITGIGSVISALNRAGSWVTNPDNLARIMKVIMGGAVILVGAAILMEKPVGQVVTSVVPAGKVLKAVKKGSGK